MANLLIKSTTGVGNKLIIQNQDGGDAIEVADTGTTLTAPTITGGLETDTNSKIKQKGAFMQSSTHQAMVLGG
jgi:hypothetical protein